MLQEVQWLRENPHFEQRPASILEFLGPEYLDLGGTVRKAIIGILVDLFGLDVNPVRIARYEEAISTGAIGVGKTTLASIVIPYMAHWVLCLKNPQSYYGLMAGSRIAFMMMSTSRLQAKDVVYSDIKARIDHSPWFQKYYHYDPKITSQFRFPKDIWIIPGDSSERTFEGFNILGGIVDEIDSHKVTKAKDYAEQGYSTIHGRMTSRFQDRGFVLLIGQMKTSTGFAARMYKRFMASPTAYAVRMSIWESLGWDKFLNADGTRNSFWFDCDRMQITTKLLAEIQGFPEHIIEIPMVYEKDFLHSPFKALRDLAGRPAAVASPLFNDPNRISLARQNWLTYWNHSEGPINWRNQLADWFRARNSVRRCVHVDIAYSAEGDALGLAMGHVPEMVEVDGEYKPFIMIDFIMRIKAAPGREISLHEVRQLIYDLKFNRGFNISLLTTDGFQSTDFRQQVTRRGIRTDVVSTDKTTLPYFDLLDAVTDDRIGIPPYEVPLSHADPEPVDILLRELSQLQEEGHKIDHPPDGSKDVADAVACVVSNLMASRRFHASKSVNANPGEGGGGTVTADLAGSLPRSPRAPRAPMPPRIHDAAPWRPR